MCVEMMENLRRELSHKAAPAAEQNNQQHNQQQSAADSSKQARPPAVLHFVFTTDCTPYQNWQSQLLVHTAKAVGEQAVPHRVCVAEPWRDVALVAGHLERDHITQARCWH